MFQHFYLFHFSCLFLDSFRNISLIQKLNILNKVHINNDYLPLLHHYFATQNVSKFHKNVLFTFIPLFSLFHFFKTSSDFFNSSQIFSSHNVINTEIQRNFQLLIQINIQPTVSVPVSTLFPSIRSFSFLFHIPVSTPISPFQQDITVCKQGPQNRQKQRLLIA